MSDYAFEILAGAGAASLALSLVYVFYIRPSLDEKEIERTMKR